MMTIRNIGAALAGVTAVGLSACGGGSGGTRVASTPTPPPSPPPPSPPAGPPPVKIFANPTPVEYASVGASVSGPGGNLDTYSSASATLGPVSASDADQPHIRFSAGGYYEIEMPGTAWDRLVHYKGLVNPSTDNNYFQPASVAQNQAYLITASLISGYTYSELGGWGSSAASRWGYVAFGTPTPNGAVPVTGSASYAGTVIGSTDIMVADNLYGGYFPLNVDGTVELNFNFGAGTLGGSMALSLPDGMNPMEIGTWAFRDTVYSAGSTTYSGSFDTNALGQNFFLGRFTGPSAEETIGAWALPFVFDRGGESVTPDGQTHQAFGAWIAKRGN
jgi:hypothetical protein